MRWIRALFEHGLTGPMIRYGLAGAIVATVYNVQPISVIFFLGLRAHVFHGHQQKVEILG